MPVIWEFARLYTIPPGNSTPGKLGAGLEHFPTKACSSSDRIKPFGLVDRGGRRCRQELDERPGGLRLLGLGIESGRERGDNLQIARKWTRDLDAGNGFQLRDLL